MKKLETIIRPEKLDEVVDALNSENIKGFTVTQVMGCGSQGGRKEYFRGTEVTLRLLPKVKIEITVSDDMLDQAVSIISATAYTGKVGDGKIFVSTVDNVIRIRTGEQGDAAI